MLQHKTCSVAELFCRVYLMKNHNFSNPTASEKAIGALRGDKVIIQQSGLEESSDHDSILDLLQDRSTYMYDDVSEDEEVPPRMQMTVTASPIVPPLQMDVLSDIPELDVGCSDISGSDRDRISDSNKNAFTLGFDTDLGDILGTCGENDPFSNMDSGSISCDEPDRDDDVMGLEENSGVSDSARGVVLDPETDGADYNRRCVSVSDDDSGGTSIDEPDRDGDVMGMDENSGVSDSVSGAELETEADGTEENSRGFGESEDGGSISSGESDRDGYEEVLWSGGDEIGLVYSEVSDVDNDGVGLLNDIIIISSCEDNSDASDEENRTVGEEVMS